MARKSSSSAIPGALRRTKAFFVLNLIVWGVIGGWYLFQPPARQHEVSRLVSNLFDSRKQVTAFEAARDLWQLYYSDDFVRAPALGDHGLVYGGPPGAPAVAGLTPRILGNTAYVVGYSDDLGNPLWAAYRVQDGDLREPPPRPEKFEVDSRTVARIESNVYDRSGYDRGHLAPNYAIAVRFGREAQEETFRMSNVCPQRHGLNAGLWKDLEQKIAVNYPARFGEVWVFAGPVFSSKPARLKRRVAIPESFYMIIVDENDGRIRTEAFLFPQEPVSTKLESYLVTIDEIETRTGLDFFRALSPEVQTSLESRRAERPW